MLGLWLASAGEHKGDGSKEVDPLLPVLLVAVVEGHGLGEDVCRTLGIGTSQGDHGGGSDYGFFFGRQFFLPVLDRLLFEGDPGGMADATVLGSQGAPDLIQFLGVGGLGSFLYEAFEALTALPRIFTSRNGFGRRGRFFSRVGNPVKSGLNLSSAHRNVHGSVLGVDQQIGQGKGLGTGEFLHHTRVG